MLAEGQERIELTRALSWPCLQIPVAKEVSHLSSQTGSRACDRKYQGETETTESRLVKLLRGRFASFFFAVPHFYSLQKCLEALFFVDLPP